MIPTNRLRQVAIVMPVCRDERDGFTTDIYCDREVTGYKLQQWLVNLLVATDDNDNIIASVYPHDIAGEWRDVEIVMKS